MVLATYGAIALIGAVGVYLVSRRLGDDRRPPAHPLIPSVLAGALWPLLLIGLVEFGCVAAYVKMRRRSGRGLRARVFT